MTSKAHVKEQTNKMNFIKIFWSTKHTVRKTDKPQLRENICRHVSDKGPVSKIYKSCPNSTIRKQVIQFFLNGQKTWTPGQRRYRDRK